MKRIIEIERRAAPGDAPYIQSFIYETEDESATVATALSEINARVPLLDAGGEAAEPIRWESSCLQKKCGACAMVIDGRPALACDTRLSERGEVVRLSPLKKFPVIADLIVDRSKMMEALMTLRVWIEEDGRSHEKINEDVYEAARCIQCGCCLEVCPNFKSGGSFYGMAGMSPMARILSQTKGGALDERRKLYNKYIFEGCGKSLACRNICPAGLDIDRLLARSNAVSLWKRLMRR
ncbi:MAG: 4Fe-4S dicluster domain-containing protein [Clostridia bacterium]|nr:4Fe-4S dicluster domain-containing protein [Clostridia bacterium]